jgi:hypothetical protein
MPVERTSAANSLVEVLDRVLDGGIVIDAVERTAWSAAVGVSVVGIDLITVEARIVVASINTYMKHFDALDSLPMARSRLPAG